jgi:hypothetical protein
MLRGWRDEKEGKVGILQEIDRCMTIVDDE